MHEYTPAWPHGPIQEVLPDIFVVTGTNKTRQAGIALQFSRNMTIIRSGHELTLINTVRLGESGLDDLDALGSVVALVRLGAFHGRDDAFYRDRYGARLWSLGRVKHEHGARTDRLLQPGQPGPLQESTVFAFETSRRPEAALHVARHGGVLLTCDSVQNWSGADRYFSPATAKIFKAQGLLRPVNISPVWRDACRTKSFDFARLLELSFRHLISAHGPPLLDEAHARLTATVERVFSGAKRPSSAVG